MTMPMFSRLCCIPLSALFYIVTFTTSTPQTEASVVMPHLGCTEESSTYWGWGGYNGKGGQFKTSDCAQATSTLNSLDNIDGFYCRDESQQTTGDYGRCETQSSSSILKIQGKDRCKSMLPALNAYFNSSISCGDSHEYVNYCDDGTRCGYNMGSSCYRFGGGYLYSYLRNDCGKINSYYEAIQCTTHGGTYQQGTCYCGVGAHYSRGSTANAFGCSPCPEYTYQNSTSHQESNCITAAVSTCSNAGEFNKNTGECDCTDPAIGTGPTCSEHSNAKTCSNFGIVDAAGQCTCTQQQALRDANNGCVCLGPETGMGPECEFSNANTCTDHGVAQPDGTCLCSTGYTGASCAGECATETHTRWDKPSAGGGFECVANFQDNCNPGFYFNADTSDPTSRTCTICPVNTYADGILEDGQYDGGKRIACKSCPDEFQVSPAGSTSVDQCQYKWKILDASSGTMQASLAAGFCTGEDAESTLHFTTLNNSAADCLEYASTKQLTFSSDVPACEDLAASEDCELVCAAARAGKSIDVTTNADGKESAAEACKVTCNLCNSGSTALATPSGCVLEHGSNSSDPATGIVRYYADEERKRYLGINYTPICELFVCAKALQEVITDSTMDSPPVCAFGSKYTDAKQEEEGNVYILFYYITIGSIAFIVCLAYSGSKYCCCRAGCDDWEWPSCSTHRFIWVGLVFRLADLATDWAFWVINVNGELFATKVNPEDFSDRTSSGGMFDSNTANFDLDAFKLAALLVCIVGSILTPIDIMSKMPACQTRREGAGMNFSCCTLGRKSAIIIALLVILVEDIPQILITVTYIIQLNEPFFDLSSDWTSTALTVGNIVVSSGSLLYNLYIVFKGCCTWKSDAEMEESLERKLAKLQATTHNDAFTGY